MCKLFSITKGQAAIVAFTLAMRDTTGNLPPLLSTFPDFTAIVRNAPDGEPARIEARKDRKDDGLRAISSPALI